jgi:hypothetical protein
MVDWSNISTYPQFVSSRYIMQHIQTKSAGSQLLCVLNCVFVDSANWQLSKNRNSSSNYELHVEQIGRRPPIFTVAIPAGGLSAPIYKWPPFLPFLISCLPYTPPSPPGARSGSWEAHDELATNWQFVAVRRRWRTLSTSGSWQFV